MNCKDKQSEFEKSFEIIKTQLEKDIATVAAVTEQKAKEIADSSESDNNLAEGVGMGAGTVIGGYIGGPAGAAVGATIGKEVGKLFEVEITNQEVSIKFDLPEVTLKDKDIKLDLPSITMKDDDIIFSSIEIVMVDRVVGKNPVVKCTSPTLQKPIPKCTVTWEDIIISVPETREKEVRIVLSVPKVSMKTQKIVLSIPEFRMATKEIKFHIPSITIRSKQDIAKRLSEKANSLVNESEKSISEKKEIIKTQVKMEVIPKANEMLSCFRESIINDKITVSSSFDPSINTINESLKNLKIKNVPETDDDYLKMDNQLKTLIQQKDESLKSFDTALEKLESDIKKSLDSLINL
jgi:hypothetical protein